MIPCAHFGVNSGGLGGSGGTGRLGARDDSWHLGVGQTLAVPGGHLEIEAEIGLQSWGPQDALVWGGALE